MEQSCKVGIVYSHFRRKKLKRRSDSSKVTDERPICKADFSPILPRSSNKALRKPLFAFQLAILTPSILMKLRGQTRSKEHRRSRSSSTPESRERSARTPPLWLPGAGPSPSPAELRLLLHQRRHRHQDVNGLRWLHRLFHPARLRKITEISWLKMKVPRGKASRRLGS